MNLVMYSGGGALANRALAGELAKMLAKKNKARIAFVPAEGADAKYTFQEFLRNTHARSKKFTCYCIAIDRGLSPKKRKRLLSSDAIFLGGGNTFYFLKKLREKRLLGSLRLFVKRGGILSGLSAGSILMTPSIRTAAVPTLDSDENFVGLKNWQALGLVPFEFSPHYDGSPSVDQELRNYTRHKRTALFACADGTGIIVEDGKIRSIGKVQVFTRGIKRSIRLN